MDCNWIVGQLKYLHENTDPRSRDILKRVINHIDENTVQDVNVAQEFKDIRHMLSDLSNLVYCILDNQNKLLNK
jgi:hypothetical protein